MSNDEKYQVTVTIKVLYNHMRLSKFIQKKSLFQIDKFQKRY